MLLIVLPDEVTSGSWRSYSTAIIEDVRTYKASVLMVPKERPIGSAQGIKRDNRLDGSTIPRREEML